MSFWCGAAVANVIGKEDGRKPITVGGPQLGMSAEEVAEARAATGYIICPASRSNNPIVNSFVLVEDAAVGAGTAHAFVASDDGRWREPLEDCHFRNQSPSYSTVNVDAPRSGGLFVGAAPATLGKPNDFSVARLKQSIEGARGYPLYEGSPDALIDFQVIAITSYATSLKTDPNVPIVQECRIRDYRNGADLGLPWSAVMLYTDCDGEPLSSGSVLLGRFQGELKAIGTIVSGGTADLDGREYDLQTGSYTAAVMFSGRYREAVVGMAGKGPMPPGNALGN